MMKKKIENMITEYYNDYPQMPDSNALNHLLMMANDNSHKKDTANLSYLGFVISQVRFIKRSVCIAQILLLAMCFFGLEFFHESMWQVAWVSAVLPVFIMGGMLEMSKSFSDNMLEMEMATKYTLNQVLVARVMLLGGINFIELSLMFLYSGLKVEDFSFTLLVYMSVPFLMTTFLCLMIVNRIRGKEGGIMMMAIGMMISLGTGTLAFYYPQVYKEYMRGYWYIMFGVIVAAITIEFIRIIRCCNRKLDGVGAYVG